MPVFSKIRKRLRSTRTTEGRRTISRGPVPPFSLDPTSPIIAISCTTLDPSNPHEHPPIHIHACLLTSMSKRLRGLVQACEDQGLALGMQWLELDVPFQGTMILARWLYGMGIASTERASEDKLVDFVKAYSVSEKLQVPAFGNAVIDAAFELLQEAKEFRVVRKAMEEVSKHCRENSRLRDLVNDWIVWGEYTWVAEEDALNDWIDDEQINRGLVEAFLWQKKGRVAKGLKKVSRLDGRLYHTALW
ncbi:unnamed protein product [Zymoseptoria tritici ST99CH_3D7]|uniref:BTB domain-containing protein n=1 Tax=Zymoseptoria tritici (strain ST99CH_3D7) TaxID=1276538 RepID=A0A1X7RFB9_ZYMT9|nr:unnamed protein product [Zymoseptoria tritici ST99CH_3D7]